MSSLASLVLTNVKNARTELKADLRYYARRGEKVTLKEIFSLGWLY